MQYATSRDGTRIAFWKSGSGPPLLLVHGITADHTRWAPILPLLEPQVTVYNMDRRGRGESGDAPAYALAREAEDVVAVVEAIGGPVSVLGHSSGAIRSLEAALLSDRIRRLVLYEPPIPTGAPVYPPGIVERMQALVDAGENERTLEVMFREVVHMPEHELAIYRQLPVWPVRVSLAPTLPRELQSDEAYRLDRGRFARLQVPVLLMVGGDSPPLFRGAIELLHTVLPDSRLLVMPGQQHIAMDTDPEMFVDQVLGFVLE